MKLLFSVLLLSLSAAQAQPGTPTEITRWQQQAQRVTITRDTWGVPHIYGKTDADVVFGLLYSQCEDDFDRVEMNYIDAIGRLAEVEGEAALYHDLRARLFMDSTQAIVLYKKSPVWLKSLLNAFADGTNYYLHTHPAVKPKLLTRFQPWMPLLFSEGSIGGNISAVSAERLKAFYDGIGANYPATAWRDAFDKRDHEPVGSNGFAIAPGKTANGHALLLINPHTSFYFRSEVQMVSQQGLNAYGAVTWGQFFIYQGFNQHCGWMHTSSAADSMDEWAETIQKRGNKLYYQYGKTLRPVRTQRVRLPYKTASGTQYKAFTMYFTHHGPVVGQQGEKWLATGMMNTPIEALSQSYLRTKATDYTSYQNVMKLNGNASNNTVFADSKGNIAYWHGNFMPRRNPRFNWEEPVDGASPKTEWQGLHRVEELVQVHNPATGWIQNCNATPFTVSGSSSPDKSRYPTYMAPDVQNYRGINAARVLAQKKLFTLDTLIAAANDPHLAAFDDLLPALLTAYKTVASQETTLPKSMGEAIDTLANWNHNYNKSSVAQTLAIVWGEKIQRLARSRVSMPNRLDAMTFTSLTAANTTDAEKLAALTETMTELTRDFGKWQLPWGEMNRFQRLTGQIQEQYDDSQPSLPVAFTSSLWGSLASFGAKPYPGTHKRYGNVGNSFVAVVEFGPRVIARSVVTGGQGSRPASPHFTDQAALYTTGQFKPVWFYPEDVEQHIERTYKPGLW